MRALRVLFSVFGIEVVDLNPVVCFVTRGGSGVVRSLWGPAAACCGALFRVLSYLLSFCCIYWALSVIVISSLWRRELVPLLFLFVLCVYFVYSSSWCHL